jgi:hypothetical protein
MKDINTLARTRHLYMHPLMIVFQTKRLAKHCTHVIHPVAYLAFIRSNNPDAALPFTTLLVKSFPSSAILFSYPFFGLSSGVSMPSRSTTVRGGSGVITIDRGGEDVTGAEINRDEKAVGSKTGGGRSFETGPLVIVMLTGACVVLRCEGLTSSKISSSSSLEGSG